MYRIPKLLTSQPVDGVPRITRKPRLLLTASTLAAFSLVADCQAADPLYHVSPWATLPQGSSNIVRGINDAESGVVTANVAAKSRAFQLDRQRGLETLRDSKATDFSAALGINNAGDIVGTSNQLRGQRAFRITAANSTAQLPPLVGDSASAAYAINNSRIAVGYSSGPRGMRAVRWDSKAVVTALPGVPNSVSTQAVGVNANGTAVGIARFADRQTAVLWRGNQAQLLETLPGGSGSEALNINNRGIAVGSAGSPSTRSHAVLWSQDGHIEDLGVLPGGLSSRALAINEKNEIVGTSESHDGLRAFIWTKATGMVNLNELASLPAGLILSQATGINNTGTIMAVGYIDDHSVVQQPANGDTPRYENHELPLQVVRLTLVSRL